MTEKFNIKECVNGRLGRMKRTVDAIYRKHLAPLGMTESQSMILLSLKEMGTVKQIELARLLNFEKSSLSRNLVRLAQEGYVNKTSDYHPTLYLSKSGHRFVVELDKAWSNAMSEVTTKIGREGWQALAALEHSFE